MLFPYLQAFPSELRTHFHPMEEELFCRLQSGSSHLISLDNATVTISPTILSIKHLMEFVHRLKTEYDLGVEGDLFKAPEPIVEEAEVELDPVAAAMWLISTRETIIPDVDSIQSEQLLIDAFYDLPPETLPTPETLPAPEEKLTVEEGIKKSVSSGSLEGSIRFDPGLGTAANLSAERGIFPGDAPGMRKASSEGDLQVKIKNLSARVSTVFSDSCDLYRDMGAGWGRASVGALFTFPSRGY